jgi:hypothetical protein
MKDAADVVRKAEDLRGLHVFRIDPVDDGATVWPVFGNRDPDVLAIVIDAAWMVHRALAQDEVADKVYPSDRP